MNAEKAKEISRAAHSNKIHIDRIEKWILEQIEILARNGDTGCRMNLVHKKLYFAEKKEKWEFKVIDWEYIALKLKEKMNELGYTINGSSLANDFHVTW